MDAEIPVNYVSQLSGHKNLKSLVSYKTAIGIEQRHEGNSHVKSCQPFKQREEKQSSLGEEPFSGLFAASNVRKIEGCTFNFSFNNAPGSSGERLG